MSLESALEEERLEILKLLERPRKSTPNPSGSFSTPSSPRQRYASLTVPRTSSPNRGPAVTSLLDIASGDYNSAVAEPGSPDCLSPPSNPSATGGIHRSRSDAATNPPRLLGRTQTAVAGYTPNEGYSFSMQPSVVGNALPLRVSHQNGGSWGRSKSPLGNHGRVASMHARATSPLAPPHRIASPPPERHVIASPDGTPIDLDYAYARLNDEALAASGGILGNLPERRFVTKDGEQVQLGSGESLTVDGGVRLQKDVDSSNDAAVADSSDEDSSDQDSNSPLSDDDEGRGRSGTRSTSSLVRVAESESRGNSSEREAEPIRSMVAIDTGGGGGPKKKKGQSIIDAAKGTRYMPKKKSSKSLLAAAEEERKAVSSKYKVRSLLPSISVTPSGSNPGATSPTTARRSGVHPSTNFDDLDSKNSTPVSSDVEADDRDLHRAQRMQLSTSPILSSPETQRVVRTIIRGEYDQLAKEIASGERRERKYLVATDLSSEAQYAMEWTIGTVLRDGDTLLAICAVDQESVEDGSKPVSDSSITDAMMEVTNQAAAVGNCLVPPEGKRTPGTSSPLSQEWSSRKDRTKAEKERYVAAEAITALVTKLLKKTRLQVKITIEVIHCKSPKHLITEIIDLVEPTLVVLGSRGRSALKGVLLGSFSNYLVTKSSVPVMVARKKLKHTKKYAKTHVRLTNNLMSNATRALQNAKVD